MAKKFDQYCPMAHALSMVGERWSLLIVRELLRGPKRYTDLAAGLPGIGTNILAARLRELEQCGLVEKRKLPPPTPVTVYELTEYGQGLNEVLWALARWGARTLGPPGPGDELYPEWGVNALPAIFDPAQATGIDETWVLKIDDDVFTARVADGKIESRLGAAEQRDLYVETDIATWFELASGELAPREAVKSGRVRAEGGITRLERCFRVLSFAPRASAAA